MSGTSNLINVLGVTLPPWTRWACLGIAGAWIFTLGHMRGERIAGQRHIDYVTEQSNQAIQIAKAQEKIVRQTAMKTIKIR